MASAHPHFPKLLLVTSFAPHPVGAALSRQLLLGYPAERLHWWTCSPSQACGGHLETHQIHYCPIPARLHPYRRLVRLKSWLVERLWLGRGAASLRRLATELQPDVVWCQLTGWAIPVFWRTGLLDTHRTHVTLWDYPTTQGFRHQFGRARADRFALLSEQMMARATTCDVVSVSMQRDLAARLGRQDIRVVHSGFEPWQLKRLEEAQPAPSSAIRIAYSGSIIAPETFEFFVRALGVLRHQMSRPIRLELFSRSFRGEPWFDPEWMVDHGLLEEEAFVDQMQGCSWGFVPMHLADQDDAYNRHSFPNKFGTSLAAGLPLIVLAHRESTAAQMFREYPVGFFSDTTDLETLVKLLGQALAIENPRQLYRDRILECARKEFDAAEMRRRLWSCWGGA
jgi:hypothetical protein